MPPVGWHGFDSAPEAAAFHGPLKKWLTTPVKAKTARGPSLHHAQICIDPVAVQKRETLKTCRHLSTEHFSTLHHAVRSWGITQRWARPAALAHLFRVYNALSQSQRRMSEKAETRRGTMSASGSFPVPRHRRTQIYASTFYKRRCPRHKRRCSTARVD